MANTPEDLEREISRLWAKVAGGAPVPESAIDPASSPAVGSNDIAWETVAMLKRQHNVQSRTWTEILEAKEHALKVFKERQAAMERELSFLRQKVQSGDERTMGEVLDVQARMSEAIKALEDERSRAEREQEALRARLDEARKAAVADAARWKVEEARWQKKEQQYLLDLTELQALSARYQEERGRAEGQAGRLAESMKEAKNALEKTLAELLRERRVREDAEAERAKALKKVDEVQKHFEELSRIWEEERGQWRQLWDRERSTWEMQRTEFAAWEEGLRREREAWHAEMEAKERDQVQYAEQMTRSLRDSSETTSKLAGVMQRLASLETTGQSPRPARDWKKALRPLLAAAALAVVVFPIWRWAAGWKLSVISSEPVAMDNPTGMAYDGSLLWASQWDGRLTSYDPRDLRAALRTVTLKTAGPYHPTALAAGAGSLWSLDTAQARILKHDAGDPGKVLRSRPAPGPAPTALAFDGQALWSYDAANKSLYRHDEDEGVFKAVPFDPGVIPTAMSWVDGRLWVFDSKDSRLKAYEWKGGAFTPALSEALGENVIALAQEGRTAGAGASKQRLLILGGPKAQRSASAWIRYRYGRRWSALFW